MKNRRKIVVDASIARAAGDVNQHPTSAKCRETLLALNDSSAVFCPNLKNEWTKHESAFARAWKVKMIQEGRALFFEDDTVLPSFREFIENSDGDEFAKKAMDKDAHLLSSAILHDKVVLALDERVRKLFSRHCILFRGVKKVLWSNPVKTEDNTVMWLKAGAKRDSTYTLESFAASQE